jgi:acyl-CoA synthetase (AMP-forming)/AMP-acid ligase II
MAVPDRRRQEISAGARIFLLLRLGRFRERIHGIARLARRQFSGIRPRFPRTLSCTAGVTMPRPEHCDTLTKLYLSAMRSHSRKAVLVYRAGGQWVDVPDWRLDRSVIRLALFVRERLGFQAGQTAAIVAPLSLEWIVSDLAVMMSGGVSAAVDPSLPDAVVADALVVAKPDLIFVGDEPDARRVRRRQLFPANEERLIEFAATAAGSRHAFSAALDSGGALDSAERAVAFRARARAVPSHATALLHAAADGRGQLQCDTLTHHEARELAADCRLPLIEPPGRAQAYCAGPLTLEMRLALYASLMNGAVTTALGTPGRDIEERAELSGAISPRRRPRWIERRLWS